MLQADSSAEVGGKINEWYHAVISHEVEHAIELKEAVSLLLQNMKHDQKVVTFYQLVTFKHDTMLKDCRNEKPYFSHASFPYTDLDHFLQFLSRYMLAEAYFHKKKYKEAFWQFNYAEQMLDEIDDHAERAEFLYRVGKAYFNVNIYVEADGYFHQALLVFQRELGYKKKEMKCKLYLAKTKVYLGKKKEAEAIFEQLAGEAEDIPRIRPIVLTALGVYAIREGRFEHARDCFERALSDEQHAKKREGIKAKALLAKTYYRLGSPIKAQLLLEQAENQANQFQCTENISLCLIIKGLYEQADDRLISEGLNRLQQNEHYTLYYETAKMLADYFEAQKQLDYALFFMRKALLYRQVHDLNSELT